MGNRPPYFILVSWLWLAGLLLFMVMVTWHIGLLPDVLASDQTWISVLLLVLTGLISLHCGYRGVKLSRLEAELVEWHKSKIPSVSPLLKGSALQQSSVKTEKYHPSPFAKSDLLKQGAAEIEGLPPLQKGERGGFKAPEKNTHSLLHTYLSLIIGKGEKNLSLNGELLAEHFHYQHAFGWFAAGAMIKLGLLGTVIGFIMMLTSIGGLDSLEIEQVQQLMQRMTQGMMVALNTTLLGLVGSMILGVQYLFLDHCADHLLVQTLTWVQQVEPQEPQPQAS